MRIESLGRRVLLPLVAIATGVADGPVLLGDATAQQGFWIAGGNVVGDGRDEVVLGAPGAIDQVVLDDSLMGGPPKGLAPIRVTSPRAGGVAASVLQFYDSCALGSERPVGGDTA